ncbi:MauE/DoxX family redox-associated membrane protein [Oleiharenicola lentus]|uniref:MauE/DoxX family redox-associated membrane protein n=1 Tax=Oleiharenicola lentus TaxID=2508720 RepID=UPI003F6660FC
MTSSPFQLRFRIVARWILGVVFLLAGIVKLTAPVAVYAGLGSYQLGLPDTIVRLIAVVLPWLEIATGALLIFNRWVETASGLAALLAATFVVALGQGIARELSLNCACFGAVDLGWFSQPVPALGRAMLLLVLAVSLAAGEWRRTQSSG